MRLSSARASLLLPTSSSFKFDDTSSVDQKSIAFLIMEPASALGIASAVVSIVAKIVPTLISLKEQWDGIRKIDETNMGFLEELDAFQFSLMLIDTEFRR